MRYNGNVVISNEAYHDVMLIYKGFICGYLNRLWITCMEMIFLLKQCVVVFAGGLQVFSLSVSIEFKV